MIDGRSGVVEGSEWRIRQVVAEQLGLRADDLAADISLTDDLAADSLDLAELMISLEEEFAVGFEERTLEHVRTYGDLVDTVLTAIRADRAAVCAAVSVRARVVGATGASLVHSGPLTPYLLESIMEAARLAGPDARLEITVLGGIPEAELERVARQFAGLELHGVQVTLRREGQSSGRSRPARLGS